MRQERTVQATIFEVFAGHQIGCELKAISGWMDGQRALVSLVASTTATPFTKTNSTPSEY